MQYSDQCQMTVRPSQWVNIPFFVLGIVFIQTGLFPLLAIVKWLEVYCWQYQFGEQTIQLRKGILSVTRTEVHYRRVKSIRVEEPLWMRLFGLANIYVLSSDPYQRELKLYAVPRNLDLRNYIRGNAYSNGRYTGAREYDVYRL